MIGKQAPLRAIIVMTALVLCIAGLSTYRHPQRLSAPSSFLESESHAAPAAQPVPWITIPDAVSPVPLPQPPPGLVPVLPADQMYVINSSVDCFTMDASPSGLVNVTQNPGPFTVYAKFVGGTGTYELKTFTGKAVICVLATGTGRATITVVKTGAASKADTYQQLIDASNGPAPGPPTPPGPAPGPPTPPGPTPVPPQPGPPGAVAPLLAAWQQETDPQRLAQVSQLAAIYRQAGTTTVNNSAFKTVGDFYAAVKKATDILLPATALTKVRAVIDTELAKALPATGPLDAPARALIAAQYLRLGSALDTLK